MVLIGALPYRNVVPVDAEHPRARRHQSSAELVAALRNGRRVGETLRALDVRASQPDDGDRALAHELARFLVRRCDDRHQGWRVVRQVMLDEGAHVPWERCERQAFAPTAQRILDDCAAPGRTPLVRVQHAAAQERARALAVHTDAAVILRRLDLADHLPVSAAAWERALVAAVDARSRDHLLRLLASGLDDAG